MKTGPHSFTDATGVEWHIEGYSTVCGPSYVDCRSEDGAALTVRPVAYLAPAGLTIPEDAPKPERKATSAEKSRAEKLYESMPVKDLLDDLAAEPYITKSGRVLTDADIEALADEAEAEYEAEVIPLFGDADAKRRAIRERYKPPA